MGSEGAIHTRTVDVPEEMRAQSDVVDPSYTYACELTTSAAARRSAQEWARAVFEGAPPPLRWFIVSGWIVGLGLRLGPRPSSSHVMGRKILSTTPTVAVLGVESFMLTARLVVQTTDSEVVHATFVRYERRLGRIIWAVAAPIHHLLVPYLLKHAAKSVASA